ncbi:hypothetical protein KCP78_12285 [Salmonella enterica subsp. enterica]|nr:hypothetical protein KCP78_12285 [Salmonella enterica subsp. enterica]
MNGAGSAFDCWVTHCVALKSLRLAFVPGGLLRCILRFGIHGMNCNEIWTFLRYVSEIEKCVGFILAVLPMRRPQFNAFLLHAPQAVRSSGYGRNSLSKLRLLTARTPLRPDGVTNPYIRAAFGCALMRRIL